MTSETTDVRSNPQEQIHHAATVIGGSRDRRVVFEAICFGKKKIKPISEIVSRTGLTHKRVLEEAAKLHNARLIRKTKIDGQMAYEKDDFLSSKLKVILKLAGDPKALAEFPTKSNPRPLQSTSLHLHMPRDLIDTKQVTVDLIDSFAKVRDIPLSTRPIVRVNEEAFQQGLQNILGEFGSFTDWGGESNDLFTTRVLFNGQRTSTAFCLKGGGTRGILVPSKMGKNGDQIQRLFRAPGEIFLVQYWGQIDESILSEMKDMAIGKSYYDRRTIYYGIINGQDTQRVMAAYPEAFRIETASLAEKPTQAVETMT